MQHESSRGVGRETTGDLTLPRPADERRLVTALFADLVAFTSEGEEADPEALRELQGRYFAVVRDAAERYGGLVEKFIGDAAVVLFGAPLAHDDDAERALHAALAIREGTHAITGSLELRIGVDTGEVVGGIQPSSGEYQVTGDAVNTAARLQQAAAPGEIWVGDVTRRLAHADFDLERLPPLALKGKARPVTAWRLLAASERARRVRPGEAPFIGRDAEVAAAAAALRDAADGRGRVVTIVGEPGIGKSRLAAELVREAEAGGFRVVWTSAHSYAVGDPFHVVRQALDALVGPEAKGDARSAVGDAGADEGLADAWTRLLAPTGGGAEAAGAQGSGARGSDADGSPPADPDPTPQARQRRIIELLVTLATSASMARPLLLVVDDLHWVDGASLAVLDELVDALRDVPALLLATTRPGMVTTWATRGHFRQVNLDALRMSDAALLLDALGTGAALDPDARARVLARGGGNPFFLAELARSSEADGGRDGTAVTPETVQEVLRARIDRLAPVPREVLQLASVIGMEFGERLLSVVDGSEDHATALRDLQREDLLVRRFSGDESRYVFRHPLIHEVAYRGMLVSRRRALHARIAGHLESEGPDDLLPTVALHWRESDQPEQARTALLRAAARAEGLYATHEAVGFLLDAARIAPDAGERAVLLERAGFQAYLGGDATRAIELFHDAVVAHEAAGQVLRALDARRHISRALWIAGRTHEAADEIDRATAGLEPLGPSRELAFAYSYRAQLVMLRPDHRSGEAWARRAITMAERVGAEDVLPHAYNNLGTSRIGLGDPGGFEDIRRSLRAAREQGRIDDAARAYVNLSGHAGLVSHFAPEEQAALLEEALAYVDARLPGGVYSQSLHQARAELAIRTGRWADALADLDAVRPRGRYFTAWWDAYRAIVAAYRGSAAGLELAERAADAARMVDDLQIVVPAAVGVLQSSRAAGAYERAASALQETVRLIGDRDAASLLATLAFEAADVAAFALRDADAGSARAMADAVGPLLARSAEDGPSEHEAAARRGLAAAARVVIRRVGLHLGGGGSDEGSVAILSRAGSDLASQGRVFDEARVRLWRLDAGDPAIDATVLAETFRSLGAVDHARASLRR